MGDRICIDPEALLQEMGWVRSLARRLVRDAAEAEDVAQDTLLVALSGARLEAHALRQWLGTVVRNLVRSSYHRRTRHACAELPTEHEACIPSPLELVERATTQRALVDTLLDLEESDRTVLLLHHWQALSNAEIARHWDVAPSTVASRLSRAHARLREKWLAQNRGDRSTALAALVVCAEPGATRLVPSARAESSRVPWKALQAGGLASVLLGAAWVLRSADDPSVAARSPESDPETARAGLETKPPSDRAGALLSFLPGPSVVEARRAVEPPPPSPSPAGPAREGPSDTIHGRVLDLEGLPVPDLSVCRVAPLSRPDEWSGTPTEDCAESDAQGLFTVDAPRMGWFRVSSPGWTTVLGVLLAVPDAGEAVLVVAPSRALGGRVVDEQGHGLPGVEVTLEVAPAVLLALGPVLDVTQPIPRVLVTDADGAFAFDDAPGAELVVTAQRSGFEGGNAVVPGTTSTLSEPLQIVLARSFLPTVTGTVVDTSGRPVEGAFVSAGQGIATTDAAGQFLVTFDPGSGQPSTLPPVSMHVRAAHAELGMAELEIPLPPAGSAPLDVELVLEGELRAIEGCVVDPRGVPVPSVQVFVLEETPFGLTPMEGVPPDRGFYRSLESMMGAHVARTDANGVFRITGLAARSYRLQALDPDRLSSSISEAIPAPSRGVRLVLDTDASGPLAGRVVDHAGQPVAGVHVVLSCRQWWSGPDDRQSSLATGASAESDADGYFALADVAREGIFLRLEGEPIVPELFRTLDPAQDPAALELVVARRCHLQVRWGDWRSRADRMHLVADDGTTLELMDLRGLGMTPLDSIPVDVGLSPPFTIPDHATHAVLTLAGQEVTRVPLHPVPGELEIVEP